MPIIPPMRGKPCILTSLLPEDAALTVPRSVTAEERWVPFLPVAGDQIQTSQLGFPLFPAISEHARVTILTTRPRVPADARDIMGPVGGPAGRGLTVPPLGEGMRKVCRAPLHPDAISPFRHPNEV